MKRAISLAALFIPLAGLAQQPKGNTSNAPTKTAAPTAEKDAIFNEDKDFGSSEKFVGTVRFGKLAK